MYKLIGLCVLGTLSLPMCIYRRECVVCCTTMRGDRNGMSVLRVDYMFFWVSMDMLGMLLSMLRCGVFYREGRCTCSSVYREEDREDKDWDAGGGP